MTGIHMDTFVLIYFTVDDHVIKNEHTLYHESFEAEKFHGFHSFYMVCETF